MNEQECPVCGAVFATDGTGEYCNENCLAVARWAARRATARRRQVRTPAVSVAQVLAFAERYAAATGHYPYYGEAVRLIEQTTPARGEHQ